MIIGSYIYTYPISGLGLSKLSYAGAAQVSVTSATDATLKPTWDNYFTTDLPVIVSNCHSAGSKAQLVLEEMAVPTNLYAILKSATLRAALVTNLKNMVTTYNLDGVSIDWEQWTWQSDRVAVYGQFLSDLRAALGSGKLITSYEGPYLTNAERSQVSVAAAQYVDYIEIGTGYYQFFRDYQTVLNNWVAMGYPKSKLLIAISCIGYGWDGSSAQEATSYANLVDILNPPSSQNDAVMASIANGLAGNPTAISGGHLYWQGTDFITNKVKWVLNNGFPGIMLFAPEYDKPLTDNRSLLKAVAAAGVGSAMNIAGYFNNGSTNHVDRAFELAYAIFEGVMPVSATNVALYNIQTGTANWTQVTNLKNAAKAVNKDIKVLISLGMDGGSAILNPIMADAALRTQLAQNLTDLCNSLGLDGIDSDYEDYYGGIVPANYDAFLVTLRQKLGTGKLITIAGPGAPQYQKWFSAAVVNAVVDVVFAMEYSGVPYTVAETELYFPQYAALGFDKSKLMLGISYLDDPTSVAAKTSFAVSQGVGMMLWSVDADSKNLLTIMYNGLPAPPPPGNYVFPPSKAVTASFTNNLNFGGISCQQEFFIGPDDTHKTVSAGAQNFVADGTSKNNSLPIILPAAVGGYKMFVQIKYQGQLILEYDGLKNITIQ